MGDARPSNSSGKERERKFLVKELPPGLSRYPHELIRQGYLAVMGRGSEQVEVRVRVKGDEHFLTVKSGQGDARGEEELRITRDQFSRLWRLTKGRRIEKVRYEIPYDGLKIELDVYRGKLRGLKVAEVEFKSLAQLREFTPPPWFGREVTGQEKYSNSHLALRGLRGESSR